MRLRVIIFTDNGIPSGESSATLRELAASVKRVAMHVVDGHVRRHDVSSWIANLFGDRELAKTVHKLEAQQRAKGTAKNFGEELSAVIERRYECDTE